MAEHRERVKPHSLNRESAPIIQFARYAKPFDVILVDDTSRLSRSTESVLSIYRKLNFAGLQLISVSQGIASRQDQAATLLAIHGLTDSSYVRELAKKTMDDSGAEKWQKMFDQLRHCRGQSSTGCERADTEGHRDA